MTIESSLILPNGEVDSVSLLEDDEARLRQLQELVGGCVEVVSLPPKRLGAPLAREAYIDHSPPRPRIYGGIPLRDPGSGRPTKKERRQLEELRGEEWSKHSRR